MSADKYTPLLQHMNFILLNVYLPCFRVCEFSLPIREIKMHVVVQVILFQAPMKYVQQNMLILNMYMAYNSITQVRATRLYVIEI